jgi:hypothetical protein
MSARRGVCAHDAANMVTTTTVRRDSARRGMCILWWRLTVEVGGSRAKAWTLHFIFLASTAAICQASICTMLQLAILCERNKATAASDATSVASGNVQISSTPILPLGWSQRNSGNILSG